jgi:hypothetical protein
MPIAAIHSSDHRLTGVDQEGSVRMAPRQHLLNDYIVFSALKIWAFPWCTPGRITDLNPQRRVGVVVRPGFEARQSRFLNRVSPKTGKTIG